MTESDHELIDEATPLVVDKDKLLNKKNQKRPQFQHYSSYLEKTQDSQKVAELYNTNMRERGCIFDSRCLFDFPGYPTAPPERRMHLVWRPRLYHYPWDDLLNKSFVIMSKVVVRQHRFTRPRTLLPSLSPLVVLVVAR
jgi:hypothetical protein